MFHYIFSWCPQKVLVNFCYSKSTIANECCKILVYCIFKPQNRNSNSSNTDKLCWFTRSKSLLNIAQVASLFSIYCFKSIFSHHTPLSEKGVVLTCQIFDDILAHAFSCALCPLSMVIHRTRAQRPSRGCFGGGGVFVWFATQIARSLTLSGR